MKQFIIKLTVFLSGLGALMAVVLIVFIVSPKDPSHYDAAHLIKRRLLQETPGERMIFVGGSNVAFGLDSKLIEQRLGKQVVNFGLHAGLGLKFPLQELEPLVRPGDTVVIIAEYELLTRSHFGGTEPLTELLLKYYPAGLRGLDAGQWLRLIQNAPRTMLAAVVHESLLGRRADAVPGNIYHTGMFNARGDLIGHLERHSEPIDAGEPLGDLSGLDAIIDFLNAFHAQIEHRGARCVWMYPSYAQSALEQNRVAIDAIDAALQAHLAFDILGTPEDFCYEAALFYNSQYHLTKAGRELRTERLCQILKQALGEPTGTPAVGRLR